MSSKSDPITWEFLKVSADKEDIVIAPGVVTAFGGSDDRTDSGETASGVSTRKHPDFLGCALPMRRDSARVLRNSPLPKIPWFTHVVFTDPATGRSVETHLIDEGPAGWTKHIGDLTVAAARVFDVHATANNFTRTLVIRIMGAAKYLK